MLGGIVPSLPHAPEFCRRHMTGWFLSHHPSAQARNRVRSTQRRRTLTTSGSNRFTRTSVVLSSSAAGTVGGNRAVSEIPPAGVALMPHSQHYELRREGRPTFRSEKFRQRAVPANRLGRFQARVSTGSVNTKLGFSSASKAASGLVAFRRSRPWKRGENAMETLTGPGQIDLLGRRHLLDDATARTTRSTSAGVLRMLGPSRT